jgi:hypothetical protein
MLRSGSRAAESRDMLFASIETALECQPSRGLCHVPQWWQGSLSRGLFSAGDVLNPNRPGHGHYRLYQRCRTANKVATYVM